MTQQAKLSHWPCIVACSNEWAFEKQKSPFFPILSPLSVSGRLVWGGGWGTPPPDFLVTASWFTLVLLPDLSSILSALLFPLAHLAFILGCIILHIFLVAFFKNRYNCKEEFQIHDDLLKASYTVGRISESTPEHYLVQVCITGVPQWTCIPYRDGSIRIWEHACWSSPRRHLIQCPTFYHCQLDIARKPARRACTR